jgi:hypothetical protein
LRGWIRLLPAALALAACSGWEAAAAAPVEARAAAGVSDPLRFVKAAYDLDPASPDKPGPAEMLDQDKPEYSPRLRELFAIQQREHGADEVGRLSMNIFTGTQDGEVESIRIEQADVDFAVPPRRIVTATFSIFDRPTKMQYYFEKIGERWYLDDIASAGFGPPDEFPAWTLSTVLKYGW